MASANIRNFLDKLDQEMRNASSGYRYATSNKLIHVVKFRRSEIETTLLDKLKKVGVPNPETVVKTPAAQTALNNFYDSLKREFEDWRKQGKLPRSRKEWEVVTKSNYKNFPETTILSKQTLKLVIAVNPKMTGSVYEKIKREIRDSINAFKEELQNARIITAAQNKQMGALGHMAHDENQAVFQQRMKQAIEDASNLIGNDATTIKALQASPLGFIWNFTHDTETGYAQITFSEATKNLTGGQELLEIRKAFDRVLSRMITATNSGYYWPLFKGSPSIAEVKKVKAIQTIVKPFIKTKAGKVKVNPKFRKIPKGKKTVTKKITAKNKAAKQTPLRSTTTGRFISPRDSRSQFQGAKTSPLALIKTLNSQLPLKVAENMGSPKLNYRTGRFANSAKVADIQRTKTGMMSIGYTYQTNPYQVFEMGKGSDPWRTPERDPRRIIDESIRELMIQYTTERFTTRRVL